MNEAGAVLRIARLDAADTARWDAFVVAHADGTFFHLAAWCEVLQRAFGIGHDHLYAERGGEIVAVLPLARVRSRLFGDRLLSTPFCVYGGAIGEPDAVRALEDAALRLARELGVQWLEVRTLGAPRDDWTNRDLFVTFGRAISADEQENLQAIPRKQRAMVRKGRKAGLQVAEWTPDAFWDIYAESVRNLGTPVYPRRFFTVLGEVFGERCEVLRVCDRDGATVAGVLSFHFRDAVLPYFGAGLPTARRLHAYDYMYFEQMCRASARGARWFDFGRSIRGTGSYDFKRNWGFEPVPLNYQYRAVRAKRLPDVRPDNPPYRLAMAAWRRLPIGVANRLGPLLWAGLA